MTECKTKSADLQIFPCFYVSVVEGYPDDVIKLRRSTPMFRAYEHVYNLLSHTFLPLFHQSEEVSVSNQQLFYLKCSSDLFVDFLGGFEEENQGIVLPLMLSHCRHYHHGLHARVEILAE